MGQSAHQYPCCLCFVLLHLQESVIQWDEALTSIRAVLEGWLEVQTKWAHLAPLFGPSGLPGQLPLEVRLGKKKCSHCPSVISSPTCTSRLFLGMQASAYLLTRTA
eukprot:1159306-Pelagomonas_calceolata.AAC.4